jgi:uncharacterized iron-regulated protein
MIMGIENNEGTSNILSTNIFFCVRVSPSTPPCFHQSSSFLDRIAASRQGGAVWLGEHHNSASDHVLQATMLQSIWTRRRRSSSSSSLPMALGLEQIQIQFQPVLDDYVAGQLTESELRRLVEWDKRWTWSFDVYEPIFRMAKNLGVSLIALNVNSEDLEYVERLGLPGLPPDRMRQYIGDPYVFLSLFYYYCHHHRYCICIHRGVH